MDSINIKKLAPINGCNVDFQDCLEAFPALEFAKTTPQSPIYHGEGDVWTHTKMVVESLIESFEYRSLKRADQEVVFLAALLHDVAKYSTTVVDPVTGHIGQPGHSGKGAIDARIALWDFDMPFEERELVCSLINSHQVPFYAITSNRTHTPEYTVRSLSWKTNLHLLSMLAEADIRGRICKDQNEILDNIELFREMARDEDCYGKPRAFADAHTAVSYFRGADVHPDYALYQEPGSRVIMMSGLPASGKNTWVDDNHPNLPIVSFDDARDELGLKHGKNEGAVAHHAIDKAKELLRTKSSFVWNSTHLSQSMRSKTIDLLYRYNAHVDMVYVEQPRSVLLSRNNARDTSLSNKDLLAMLVKWDIPSPIESHGILYEANQVRNYSPIHRSTER